LFGEELIENRSFDARQPYLPNLPITMQENAQIVIAKNPANPTTVSPMKSGFVVMSNSQFLPGYCLLLAYSGVGA
jgi:hypothetical protein